MVNSLTQARTDVADALNAAGLKAIDYVGESVFAPVCVVVPNADYVAQPVGTNPFKKPYSINLQILVLAGKGTNKGTAAQLDQMLTEVIEALEDDWEITAISEPSEANVKGVSHLGAVVSITTNSEINKEVI